MSSSPSWIVARAWIILSNFFGQVLEKEFQQVKLGSTRIIVRTWFQNLSLGRKGSVWESCKLENTIAPETTAYSLLFENLPYHTVCNHICYLAFWRSCVYNARNQFATAIPMIPAVWEKHCSSVCILLSKDLDHGTLFYRRGRDLQWVVTGDWVQCCHHKDFISWLPKLPESPFLKILRVDNSRGCNKAVARLDNHVLCRNNIHDWRHPWIFLRKPYCYWDVVFYSLHKTITPAIHPHKRKISKSGIWGSKFYTVVFH